MIPFGIANRMVKPMLENLSPGHYVVLYQGRTDERNRNKREFGS